MDLTGATRCRPKLLLPLTLTLLAGCGAPRDDATPDSEAPPLGAPDGTAPPPSDLAPVIDGAPAPDAGPGDATLQSCQGLTTPAKRDYTLKLKHDGLTRIALVHIPPSYDGTKPVALVFNNHGNLHYASMQASMSHLNTYADQRGVMTVAPQGTGGLMAGWNVGQSPLGYLYDKVDDVGFFKAMLAELEKTICIDRRRVFCTGFSLGGSMCYRLSCDWSERIAAIASVSGPDGTVTCNSTRAVPLLHIHGTADSFASYTPDTNGGMNKGAEFYVMNHAKRSGCQPQAKVTLTQGKVTCKTYGGCDNGAEATLCTVTDGGHTWPGGDGWLLGGTVNKDINASEMLLDFFDRYPL